MPILSDLKRSLISRLQAVTRNCIYEAEFGGVTIVRRGGLGFLKKIAGGSTPEEQFLSSLHLAGKTVFDIGGYIGILTVFFARAAGPEGRVVVFEPNPANCARIREHLRLNEVGTVTLLDVAIGEHREQRQLAVSRYTSASGSLEEGLQARILQEKGSSQEIVEVLPLDEAIAVHGLPSPDFVKIDVEGMEYRALRGMAGTVSRCSPDLYVEIHGAGEENKIENIRRVVHLLASWGYDVHHVETGQRITPEDAPLARRGHIFCRRSGAV